MKRNWKTDHVSSVRIRNRILPKVTPFWRVVLTSVPVNFGERSLRGFRDRAWLYRPRPASWVRLLSVDDICGLPTPWNGELGLPSAPETLQFRPQPFGTVYQQLWDCLPAQFRHFAQKLKLSTPAARRWSASEDYLFCALQSHWLLVLLVGKNRNAKQMWFCSRRDH